MSRASLAYRCDRCGRPTARRRLIDTRIGHICTKCASTLGKRLRRPPTTKGTPDDQA